MPVKKTTLQFFSVRIPQSSTIGVHKLRYHKNTNNFLSFLGFALNLAFSFGNKRKLKTTFVTAFFIIVPLFGLRSASKSPYVYSPYLLIDCQKSQTVYQKSCFRRVAYLTRAMVESGLFEDVLSPSHIYFIENLRTGFVSFEKKRPYSNSKWRERILSRYPKIFRASVDASQRFVLLSIAENTAISQETNYRKQEQQLKRALQIYLEDRNISHVFWEDADTSQKGFQRFPRMAARLSLRFTDADALWGTRAKLYALQQELQNRSDIKALYSGSDVWQELQILWGKQSRQGLTLLREFVSESRSLYWQAQEGVYAITLYQDGKKPLIQKEVLEQLARKYFSEQIEIEVDVWPQNFHHLPTADEQETNEDQKKKMMLSFAE